MSSTSLKDQTLRLTVSLEAEEQQEEEQDEEIGGLINSDGEVVEWDASKLITTAHSEHGPDFFRMYMCICDTTLILFSDAKYFKSRSKSNFRNLE